MASLSSNACHRQNGFFLPGLAIAVTVFSLILGAMLYRYAEDNARTMGDERAKVVGSRLAAIDDAVKTYTTAYFTQIQRQEQIQRNGHTIPASRVRAPTTADLHSLGFLTERHATPIVYNGRSIGFEIQLSVPTTGCAVPNCNVTALTVSTQPMVELRDQNTADIRRATLAASMAGIGRAGITLPESPTVFVSIDNTQIGANPSGTVGLIAVTNGYDSKGFLEFARRDGSLPMTGDINMRDDSGTRHNIRNIEDVETNTVTASGRLQTGEYLDLDGPIVIENTSCPKDGLVARGAGGLILSCQSGAWKKAISANGGFWAEDGAKSCGSVQSGRQFMGGYCGDVRYLCVDGRITQIGPNGANQCYGGGG